MGGGIHRPSAGYQLLTLGLAALMVSAVLGSMTIFWRMDVLASRLLLVSLGAVAGGWMLWRFPALTGVLSGAAVTGVAIWQRYNLPLKTRLLLVLDQWRDFYGHMRNYQWDSSFGEELGYVFIWAVAIPLACLIVREALRRGSAFWSIIAGVTLFGTQWAWYFDPAVSYFAWYLMIGFVLWAAASSARRDTEWAASGRRVGYRSHFASVLAWVLAGSLIAATFPINWEPIDLGRAADRIQEAFPAFRHMRGGGGQNAGGRFNLRLTGFSNSTLELGGRITLDPTVVFNLVADEPLPGTAYLRGNTASTYTGRGWALPRSREVPYPQSGILPSTYLPSVPRAHVTYRIEPLMPIGVSIFTVVEALRVEGPERLHLDTDGNIWTDRVLTRSHPYAVDSRWIMYSEEQIRSVTSGTPGEALEPYLQLPVGMTERVRSLTTQLTSGHSHPIDKAVAIETYLRGLPYSLNVPNTPSGKDFVDYFLFELKQGYCVYYASAMVVMLRDAGIPARWVQGFAVPADGEQQEKDGKVVYPVRNALAHAWVEAYFPGYGWVPFEPTPRSDLPRIDRSMAMPVVSDQPILSDTIRDLIPEDPAFRDDLEGREGDGSGLTPAAPSRRWPAWVLRVLGGFAVLYLLWWAIQRRLRKQDELTATVPGEMVQESWEKVLWLMSRFGFGRKGHQTAHEYAREVGDALPPLQYPAQRVAEDYDSARFGPGNRASDTEAARRAKDFWEKADEILFDRFGWAKYLWKRLTWW